VAHQGEPFKPLLENQMVKKESLVQRGILPVWRLRRVAETFHLHHQHPVVPGEFRHPTVPGVAVGPEAVEEEKGRSSLSVKLPVEGKGDGRAQPFATPFKTWST
jgi:hypothetical protein